MSTSLPFLLLLLPTAAEAVDVCRAATIEEDPFENTRVVRTNAKGYELQLKDDAARFTVDVVRPGVTDAVAPAGLEMHWVLDNDTRVTFVADRPSKPSSGLVATQYSAGVYSSWKLTFPVSLEAAHAMASGTPTLVRYTMGDQQHTFELDRRSARRYQRDFACIANHFPAPPAS